MTANQRTYLKTSEIKNNPNNPRLIKDEKFKKLVQSIKEFPEMLEAREVVVNKDHIILGGNMRFKAAKEAGLKEIPVKIVDWDEDKQRQFIIKDNVSGGDWDWDIIANEWDAEELEAWGLDLPEHTNLDKEVEEDEAPEVSSEPPVSVLGEIYQLGRHRVMCGDSTKDSATLLNGATINMIFTDPPYGIDYSGGRTQVVATKTYGKLMGDKDDDISHFINAITEVANGVDTYICLSPVNLKDGVNLVDNLQGVIVWKKPQPGLGYQFIRRYCEFILFATDRKKSKDDASEFDFWDIGTDAKQDYEHGTQKPVALSARAIKYSSQPNGIVLDLFLGSGSTLIACEQTDRTCYGMELDPRYVDVIRKRYAKHTTGGDLPNNWQELTPEV